MRILHIGGYRACTQELALTQARHGHQVEVLALPPQSKPLALNDLTEVLRQNPINLASPFDVVHLHISAFELSRLIDSELGVLSLIYEAVKEPAKAVVVSVVPVIFSHFGYYNESLDYSLALKGVAQVFLHDPGLSALLTQPNCRYIGFPLRPEQAPSDYSPNDGPLNILFVTSAKNQAASELISSVFDELVSEGIEFSPLIIRAEIVKSVQQINKIMANCDIFLENPASNHYGPLAVWSMMAGKTVLSGNDPALQPLIPELRLCPVLDISATNLKERLMSLIKEPKSLRDLGKRCRKFAETNHNAELFAVEALDVYQDLV